MSEPVPESRDATRNVERAMMIMVFAMLLLPTIDAIAKLLSATVPSGVISWSRFVFQVAFLAPFAIPRWRDWRKSPWLIHAARGVLLAVTTLLFFASLTVLPLADAISIFFVEPLILTLLSVVLLGETIGWRRLSAVAVGFIGALIVVRPSYAVFGVTALLPLGAALGFALYLILTRRIAPREDPITMQFLAGFFGLIAMSISLAAGTALDIAVLQVVWPNPKEWLLMVGIGIVATAGHLMVVHAFRRAEAAILAPFQYIEIISATTFGFILFGDFPDPTKWCGIAIIIGSGIYVFHRERTLARSETAMPEPL